MAAGAEGGEPRPAPAKPISPAARMINGNGTSKKKMATKAAAAIATITPLFSARRPMRTTASSTIASTAALRPKNSASTTGTSPRPAYSQDSAMIATNPGSTNNVPATRPPSVRCSSRRCTP